MPSGSKYGVHRFWGGASVDGQQVEQDTQEIAGMLVAYIREMGVSSEMYTLMTQGSPTKVKYLDDATLKRLNIVTTYTVQATLLDQDGAAILRLTETRPSGGTDTMDFYCSGPRLMARVYLEPSRVDELDSPDEKLEPPDWDFTLGGGEPFRVPRDAYTFLPPKDGKIGIEVYVPPALLREKILKADFITLMLREKRNYTRATHTGKSAWASPTVRFGGWGYPPDTVPPFFRTALQTVASSCH